MSSTGGSSSTSPVTSLSPCSTSGVIGLSDKFHDAPTLEQRTNDILAVMNAAGLDRPALVGASEGGLMAQPFAAQHPERVDRLVLLNTNPGRSGLIPVHRDPDGSLRRLKQLADQFEKIIATRGSDPQLTVDRFVCTTPRQRGTAPRHSSMSRGAASNAPRRSELCTRTIPRSPPG